MSTKNETITQALGLEPVEGQDIYFQKVAKECVQVTKNQPTETGLAGVLTRLGENAKFYHFLDESSLSNYEKDLLFRGFNVGAAIGKAHIFERLTQLLPAPLVKMIMGVDNELSEDGKQE